MLRTRDFTSISSASAALALVLALLASGCGDDAKATQARATCRAEAERVAEANVVRQAFAAGKLGSADSVRRAVGPTAVRPDGSLAPYLTLTGTTRYRFDQWIHTGVVHQKLDDQELKAILAVRAKHWPGC